MGKIFRLDKGHQCDPPRRGANNFFSEMATLEPVDTIYECDCGRLWIVGGLYRGWETHERVWRPVPKFREAKLKRMLREQEERQ